MDDIRVRIAQDLRTAASRLRQLQGTAAVEQLPRTIGDGCLADEVDAIQVNESREISFATRELLMARMSRLSAALDRMNDGHYGVCVECGKSISATRLHAMPEAQACVHCTGLLQKANDVQLAGVLAHELAHDDLGHGHPRSAHPRQRRGDANRRNLDHAGL